jgi:hypothetical protein
MRTHVEFRSSEFPAQPGEDEQINPGRYGKSLADYLREQLTARGISAGEPYAEDWGWAVPIDNPEFPLWIGCGNYEEYPDGFLCFIEPRKPYVRKLFRKIDTTAAVGRVASALDAILQSHPKVREVRWWSEEETGR